MMLLSQLAVVFVGIAGNHHEAVEQQLAPTLEEAGITELVLADGDLNELLRHTRASREIVRKLHVDGVIAGAVVSGKRAHSFRVVMYDGDGTLSADSATPFSGRVLAKTELDVLASNFKDAVETIESKHRPKSKHPRHDNDAPPGFAASAPSKPVAEVDDATPPTDPAVDTVVVDQPAAAPDRGGIHVHAGLTLGIVSRSLSPDPNTVKSYSSVPVGTGGFDLGIDVGARTTISGSYERTLEMHSLVSGNSSTSSIGRWQLLVSYDLWRGVVTLAPIAGIGGRSFEIDSTATMRTPDTDYTYVVVGASITKPIGRRVALRAIAAYEPVVGGAQPITTVDASRWGFDVGAALEVKPTTHAFLRAAFDYQQFSWSWAMTGGATDGYPTATVGGGAVF